MVNGGSGAAYNVRVVNDLADELGVNLGATQSATPSCGGDTWDIANPGGTDNLVFTIDEVPAATTCRLEVVADVPETTQDECSIPNDGPESNRIAGEWGCGGQFVQQGSLAGPYSDPLADDSPDFVFAEPSLRLDHDVSFCNLCDPVSPGAGSGAFDLDDGRVVLQVRNNGQSRIQDLRVVEELPTGGARSLTAFAEEIRSLREVQGDASAEAVVREVLERFDVREALLDAAAAQMAAFREQVIAAHPDLLSQLPRVLVNEERSRRGLSPMTEAGAAATDRRDSSTRHRQAGIR